MSTRTNNTKSLRNMATETEDAPSAVPATAPTQKTRKAKNVNPLASSDFLAELYVNQQNAVDKVDGASKWNWAKQLSDTLDGLAGDGERNKVAAEIGAKIAEGLGMAKPYSRQWVMNHVSAYRAFPECPQTPEDARRFRYIAGGNAGKLKEQDARAAAEESGESSGNGGDAPDPLAGFRKCIAKLKSAGFLLKDLEAALKAEYK